MVFEDLLNSSLSTGISIVLSGVVSLLAFFVKRLINDMEKRIRDVEVRTESNKSELLRLHIMLEEIQTESIKRHESLEAFISAGNKDMRMDITKLNTAISEYKGFIDGIMLKQVQHGNLYHGRHE